MRKWNCGLVAYNNSGDPEKLSAIKWARPMRNDAKSSLSHTLTTSGRRMCQGILAIFQMRFIVSYQVSWLHVQV